MNIEKMLNSDDIEIFNLGIELKKLENGGNVSVVELMKYQQNMYCRMSEQLLKQAELFQEIKNKNNV